MVEDASARANGGDAEAPAEAPPADEKLKHTRSSRRRLERVLTESSLKAEDRVDEYLEWFEAEPPAEIQQLRSCWCRNLFRFILYGATIAALVYFFVGTYKSKRRETFLSPDKNSGDCTRQFLPSLTGTYRLDTNARWESDPDFEPQLALFIVEFRALPSEDYAATMGEVASELREIEPMPLLESILFSATHVISVRDGAVRVRFDVDAASFMDLPTIQSNVAGCPTLVAAGGDQSESEAPFEFGMRVADGNLVFEFEKHGLAQCVATEVGTSLETVLKNEHRNAYATGRSLDLTVDLRALVAATAINYGLVKPEDFMVRLDPKSFERREAARWEDLETDVDYAGYVLRNVPWAVLSCVWNQPVRRVHILH